jgi:hypothetical protein
MDALVEISQNLSQNTPQWALKVSHEMITQWKKVGKAYNLDVSLPPFVIRLEVNVQDAEVQEEEGALAIQVAPREPFYVEFPNGSLDEEEANRDDFRPYGKELWPFIIKEHILATKTIGFVFVCETQVTDNVTGEVKEALLAQYQGYGELSTTYYQEFKHVGKGDIEFGEIEELPEANMGVLKSLEGLFERRMDKEVAN